MNDTQEMNEPEQTATVKYMVHRFLSWRLPETFRPDGGITFKPEYNNGTAEGGHHQPTGTNLFDATQAEDMVRHMLEWLPSVPHAAPRKFTLGQRVTKTKGSNWTGHVVGFYSTKLTPVGYCVESETERGSVQIYPEAALKGYPA